VKAYKNFEDPEWDGEPLEGRVISAQQFLENMCGDLKELFGSPDALRTLWANPTTRKQLLSTLEGMNYSGARLEEIQRLLMAEGSDLYDVLANVAYALKPITREARVQAHREAIESQYDDKLQAFISFVLGQYIQDGVSELDPEKLPALLELKYQDTIRGANELGGVVNVKTAFTEFQQYLYE